MGIKASGRVDYDKLRRSTPLSPRLKQAVRLYGSGIAKTKASAARAAGLSPATFYIASSAAVMDPQVNQLMTEVDRMVSDNTISTRKMIEQLSRKAIGKIGNLMDHSQDETVKLRAAIDLADRGHETSKIQKLQVESLHLTREDQQALAEAMVAAAETKGRYAHLADENFIKLDGGLSDGKADGNEGTNDAEGSNDAEGRQGRERNLSDARGEGRRQEEVKLIGPPRGD